MKEIESKRVKRVIKDVKVSAPLNRRQNLIYNFLNAFYKENYYTDSKERLAFISDIIYVMHIFLNS